MMARMEITREVFEAQRRPRFGTANPERMQLAFWEWMIRGDDRPPDPAENRVLSAMGQMMRGGKLKSRNSPYRARDLFNVPLNREDGPIWTFDRMGATQTELEDGRAICIGGEHEDYYDPDFCIYNDVIVLGPTDQIEILGYPKSVFPPTDFHTATLMGTRIIIIGCMGYPKERRPGHTPVYELDLSTYKMSSIETTGSSPGWLSRHEAALEPDDIITIRGGEIIEEHEGKQRLKRNIEEYSLDIRSGLWRQLTSRNWLQFAIHQKGRRALFVDVPNLSALYPSEIEHTPLADEQWNRVRFLVEGIAVSVTKGVSEIEIIVEGDLAAELGQSIANNVMANVEAATGLPCEVVRL
jgi:hypothetical protein